MILDKASNIALIREFGSLTTKKILESNPPAVAKLKRQYGIKKTESVIGALLSDLSQSFDGSLEREEIEEIAAEITSSRLSNLSMEEVYMACRRIKMADNNFSKLNVNKVLKVMERQLRDRIEAFGLYNQNRHLSSKRSDPNRTNGLEETKKKFKEAQIHYINQRNSES
jgi:glucose-6-phosphate 1-dehydrogenase